jgi:hypothetical protein
MILTKVWGTGILPGMDGAMIPMVMVICTGILSVMGRNIARVWMEVVMAMGFIQALVVAYILQI